PSPGFGPTPGHWAEAGDDASSRPAGMGLEAPTVGWRIPAAMASTLIESDGGAHRDTHLRSKDKAPKKEGGEQPPPPDQLDRVTDRIREAVGPVPEEAIEGSIDAVRKYLAGRGDETEPTGGAPADAEADKDAEADDDADSPALGADPS
ncbi:hypothetical protein, partial [Actinomadura sp. KC06]|uniref:hypothetical protein n=1 Tax=Actinomadura sp. KC06 TaxID=2530369 RepID=UPI001A9E8D1E